MALHRAVAAVCGVLGVGKSETASLLAHYLQQIGVGCCVLSGDNYPRRIPAQNDAERLRIYRCGGIRGLLTANCYTAKRSAALMELMEKELDASAEQTKGTSLADCLSAGGTRCLSGYLEAVPRNRTSIN